MKLKTKLKALIISLLAITTIITTLAPAVPVEAATKYESFELTSNNAYKAGLCDREEYLSDISGKVVIPSTFEYDGRKYKITAIGESAFNANKKITSVKISDTVKKIGDGAFSGCTKLKTVKLPKKLDSIGMSAFRGCSSLKKININAKTVGDAAFEDCSKLVTVTFGDNVKKIGGGCFHRTAIKTINFGKNITEIGHDAVCSCPNLESITIGENVTALGDGIEAYCDNVKTITIKSTKLTAKKCGTMGGPKGDMYLAPFINWSCKETIKVPKEKLEQYKKFLGNGGWEKAIIYKSL